MHVDLRLGARLAPVVLQARISRDESAQPLSIGAPATTSPRCARIFGTFLYFVESGVGVRAPSMTSIHQDFRELGSGQYTSGEMLESVAAVCVELVPRVSCVGVAKCDAVVMVLSVIAYCPCTRVVEPREFDHAATDERRATPPAPSCVDFDEGPGEPGRPR